jgi:dimethylhistidine N-methyltransferase
MQSTKTELTQFAKDVMYGFEQSPKSIPSKYFYDREGDRIFQQIMEMPEYYLTRCEFEILEKQATDILKAAEILDEPFNLVEFGAGDGLKTKLLLNRLTDNEADFIYYPVDISASILNELTDSLANELPGLKVEPMNMDYFSALHAMKELNDQKTLVLFLGSNIGNFHFDEAAVFLEKLKEESKTGDLLLLGVDLKKDPDIILNAYDDPHGITAAFNLNLLSRMNRELEADFDLPSFSHYTLYEEETGEVLSYLRSLKEQMVSINTIRKQVKFGKDELIHTEISKKYGLDELEKLAGQLDFEVINHFRDAKNYFTDTLWRIS